ncbi:MAG: hypothetical protein KAT75_09395 [Dehalococcoidia bacterium]|nr:hypothetical protein [Dehalococcoidia bacterium]
MKLGKTARTALIAGVFIVAFIIVFQMRAEAISEQGNLDVQLGATQLISTNLATQKENLEKQLAQFEVELDQASTSLDASKAKFPADVQSIEYDEVFFDLAYDWDLDIISLAASEPTSREASITLEPDNPEEEEGVTYSVDYRVTSFQVVVQGKPVEPAPETEEKFREYIAGTVFDILGYFNAIATGDYFSTTTVELVDISIPEPPTEEELALLEEADEEADEGTEEEKEELLEAESAQATIMLTVYSYQGE